ncbi:SET domain-containing protein-lysine N-methyltransferase [Salipaludibacillus keqinensis]|uniref:SET domain-containing protein-lysine N-methyltransferase n=1 Tax=Salipaludibacillus keqinensis TaxID=2045207 RepID=A0A323T9B1_9BACI|nr:SET domain-containing protein-lysine N-methyltransferase [Salipaludibacillus keqinensis]
MLILRKGRGLRVLEVKQSPGKGRGVFTLKPYRKGDIIEKAPVIIIPKSDLRAIMVTVMVDYFFQWGREGAVALGYGSLFNHSYKPNAEFILKREDTCIHFRALRNIAPGEEVTINYKGKPDRKLPVPFEVVE